MSTLNRAQRRKIAASLPRSLVERAATPWARDDAAWFSTHPRRAHRVREAFPGEHDPKPDFVVVRQLRPGARVRKPFTLIECSSDLVGTMQALALRGLEQEGAAHALYDLPGGRWLPGDEVLALIAAYETTSPGGGGMN